MWQRINPARALTLIAVVSFLSAAPPVQSQDQPQPVVSLAELLKAARDGDSAAQLYLGRLFDEGTQVPQDFARARQWYEQAATAGLAAAQNSLGRLLGAGLGGPADLPRAFELMKQAADDGTAAHLYDLAQMYENGAGTPQDMTRAASLYEQAAGLGHRDAAVSLGVLYQNGTGVAQDFARARALYEPAATAGHSRAQNNLGLLYTRGSGVVQDYERAAALFQAAAASGLSTAMTNLSVMYENGFGLPQSDDLAADWARRAKSDTKTAFLSDPRLGSAIRLEDTATTQKMQTAARAGDPLSAYLLAFALLDPANPAPDPVAAARFMEQAARAGIHLAQANLAMMYFEGVGLPQDYVLARVWASLASLGTDPRPLALRDRITRKMTSGQINESQQIAQRYWQSKR
ncbi:tetratricopeptide repeat protein [Neptunicoccus sediminis]|uniref:tetratricopeptide repeat protein n=1 Tax=Neptunicoccus sediminis TaxID=1892596 RepID=UPI000845D500|nr:SEL1-like repeat protein [Neptunicoccus sediminis]